TTPRTTLTNGELKITGTSGNDTLRVTVWDKVYLNSTTPIFNVVEVRMNGSERFYDATTLTKINISMLQGDDSVIVDSASSRELTDIRIDMGSGAKEYSTLLYTKTRGLTIQSGGSVLNDIYIGSSTVRNFATIDTSKWYYGGLLGGWFDGCTGADKVGIQSSSFNTLTLSTGNANDGVWMDRVMTTNSMVNLGTGDDIMNLSYSNVVGGWIVGGTGNDLINSYWTAFGGYQGGFERFSYDSFNYAYNY
ncbi:MAG: hypothetical protein ACKO3P_15315, partial [Planctomycetaceae bacterium]